ncbi:MAG TPA: xanthine dehydrogenase family protein subunit M [Candidatus Dormibacteraeota bacterium]|nr:xanthine dehydrogenase family protein subunit M [Candidatus Dormibacteraeota bacterium]
MKPPPFEYVRPSTLGEAVEQLASAGDDAKLLAGGQSLVPLLNFRLAAPNLLVDLNGVAELSFVEAGSDQLRIGAMTRTRTLEVSPEVAKANPLLASAAGWIGHVQIRNRGTVGGSLAHADPSAELPALCVLLDARIVVTGPKGNRTVGADKFFKGLMSTALEHDEVLTEVTIPNLPGQARWGFREFAQRHGDFAVAGAACVVQQDAARLVVFGVADAPLRCTSAERELARDGGGKTETVVEALRDDLARVDGSPQRAYQRRVAEAMVAGAVQDARGRGR